MRATPFALLLVTVSCSFSLPASEEAGQGGTRLPEAADAAVQPDASVGPGPDLGTPMGPAGCKGMPVPKEDDTLTLVTADGRQRSAEVHVPKSYDGKAAVPLVLSFHGFSSNPAQQEEFSQMKRRSDQRGFILAYPRGSGDILTPPSWNAKLCCGAARERMVDDVGFVRLLIERLSQGLCIDQTRVYATGFSNGGFFSYRLACELSDRIAAVAPVAGQILVPDCAPPRPVPVLHFHGTRDTFIPMSGGPIPGGGRYPSVEETVAFWAKHNGCKGERKRYLVLPDSYCERYEGCRDNAEVALCLVEGGGHTWPGGSRAYDWLLGYTSPHLMASDLMLDFFERPLRR